MSTIELLEQVKALPVEEPRHFVAAIHEVEKELPALEPAATQEFEPFDIKAWRESLEAKDKPGQDEDAWFDDEEEDDDDAWFEEKDKEKEITAAPMLPSPFDDTETYYRGLHELGMPCWTEEDGDKFTLWLRRENTDE